MDKKTKITISIASLLVILIGFLIAITMYYKPHINIAKSKANITSSPHKILIDFKNDETEANIKYLDKIIEVRGIIEHIEITEKDTIVILESESDMGSIRCHIDTKNYAGEKLQSGDFIHIKGLCTGYLMDVVFIRCIIVNHEKTTQ